MGPTFRNPKIYVTTPEPTPYERLLKIKRIASFIFAGTFTVGFFWLLFFSPAFAVSEIIIDGPATSLMRERFKQFLGKNIFLLDAERLERELVGQYPRLKSITVYRGLPNALKIVVTVRREALIWESEGKKYLVDLEGVPFANLTEEYQADQSLEWKEEMTRQAAGLPQVSDTRHAPLRLGSPLVSAEFVEFVRLISRDFTGTTNLTLRELKVAETTFQIEAVTAENFSIFFDTTRRADRQLAALNKLLDSYRDQITEYVDLRVAGKAYVK